MLETALTKPKQKHRVSKRKGVEDKR